MKAMVLNEFGKDSRFSLQEVLKPEPKSGEVLVKVVATSVNWADCKAKEFGDLLDFSPTLPGIFGMDMAGIVEAVGERIEGFKTGDRVFGCVGGVQNLQGTNAEYVTADHRLLSLAPEKLPLHQSASLPLSSITAWEGLFKKARIKRGDSLLVYGGAGGVGHVACQLGLWAGAEVFATASNPEQREFLTSVGVKNIIMRNKPDFEKQINSLVSKGGFDVVFDTIGMQNIENAFKLARREGQVVTTLALAPVDLSLAHAKGLSIHVVYMLMPMLYHEGRIEHGKILRTIRDIVDHRQLTPRLHPHTFLLEGLNEAYDLLTGGKAQGKIVVRMFAI